MENCRSGGSQCYNALVKTLRHVDISQSLQNGVVENFWWVWLLNDDSIVNLSTVWFHSVKNCKMDVEKHTPSFDFCGNTPSMTLHIMSTCKCGGVPPKVMKKNKVYDRCMEGGAQI